MSAITALTAQNTRGVQGVYDIPPEFIRLQIDSVMSDIGADAWKTGMLSNADTIAVVAERARHYQVERLVVDPVMVAKGGDALLQPEARDALIEQLLPLAYVVTPNHHEAQVLTGLEIHTVEDMCRAAEVIYAMGPKNVVVKGGHLPVVEAAIDVLYDGTAIETLEAPRVDTPNTHGTGCTYASSIAAELAKGRTVSRGGAHRQGLPHRRDPRRGRDGRRPRPRPAEPLFGAGDRGRVEGVTQRHRGYTEAHREKEDRVYPCTFALLRSVSLCSSVSLCVISPTPGQAHSCRATIAGLPG